MRDMTAAGSIVRFLHGVLTNFNYEKYFKRRAIVTDAHNKTPLLIKYYYLFYLKRKDAYHCCSFGADINTGNFFATAPLHPHGPKGIIIGNDVKLGMQVTVYYQVMVSGGGYGDRRLRSTWK